MERYLREGCLNHLSDLRGFDAVRNDEVRPGFVRNVVTVPDGASNLYRCAHGGYLMQLVDVAACMAAWSLGKRVVTQQVSLNFTRSVKLGGFRRPCRCDLCAGGNVHQRRGWSHVPVVDRAFACDGHDRSWRSSA